MHRVNGVVFGATSLDSLLALSSDEVSSNVGHRLSRLAGHLLQQQSFYPVFPAPSSSAAQVQCTVFSVQRTLNALMHFKIRVIVI